MDYTTAARAADKLRREHEILRVMLDSEIDDERAAAHIDLLVSQAKRVRTASNLAVRALARLRDQLQD